MDKLNERWDQKASLLDKAMMLFYSNDYCILLKLIILYNMDNPNVKIKEIIDVLSNGVNFSSDTIIYLKIHIKKRTIPQKLCEDIYKLVNEASIKQVIENYYNFDEKVD